MDIQNQFQYNGIEIARDKDLTANGGLTSDRGYT